MGRSKRSRGGGSVEELVGYRDGLRYRLEHAEIPGPDRERVRRSLEEGSALLERGDLPGAELALGNAEDHLDSFNEETDLIEHPRGLVDYVPSGDRGRPPPREEEPLANRMLLVERLWHVRAADGYDVEGLREPLRRAEAAYRAGDRATARRLSDEVHTALEAARRPRRGPPGEQS